MKDLYENSEISFALFWIALYVATSIILDNLGDNKTALAVGLAVISVLMFLFVYRNGLLKKYGLDGWGENNRALLWFIPLWIIASGNFWGGFMPDCHGSAIISAAVSMAFVGFVEELVFRGFLFKAMLKDGNVAMAIIVSSVTFGLGHIFSLFTGDSFIESLTGIVVAITMGFVLTMVFFKCGSLIPCIIAHCVIDVSSVFTADKTGLLNVIYIIVFFSFAIGYCLYLLHIKTPDIHKTETNIN